LLISIERTGVIQTNVRCNDCNAIHGFTVIDIDIFLLSKVECYSDIIN